MDGGAVFLVLHAVLAEIAVGAHADIEVLAVGACDDVLDPMEIDGTGRQVGDLLAGRGDRGGAVLIGKAHDRIRVGHVEILADQSHADRRVEAGEKRRLRLGLAVAVRIAQQRDAVGARNRGAGPAHAHLHEPARNASYSRLGRGIALGDEHVAIGQHVEPARMVEPGGEGLHREARGRLWGDAVRPALGAGQYDGRQKGLHRRG